MKAICAEHFGDPQVLQLRSVPGPVPGIGQVVVRVCAAGVNPVETYIRSGNYGSLPALPWTPGHDGAGVVMAVGEGAEQWREGDRVYLAGSISGTYAEQVLANVQQIHHLPAALSFAQGAALGIPYATAYRALFQRAHAKAGETVLVHGGSGSVGLATIQFARAAGMQVIATGGTESGRLLAAAQGAHHVLDHYADEHWQQILDLTDGRGVDVIVEMLANVNLGRDLAVLAPAGRVAVVGSRGPVEINPRDAMAREAEIRGVMLWQMSTQEYADAHAGIQSGLASGALRPIVAEELPLDQAALAHENVLQRGVGGKIVLIP